MTTLLKINKKIYYYFRKSDKNHFKKKLKINIKNTVYLFTVYFTRI